MKTLIIPPDPTAYSVTDGQEILANKLLGGKSRYRVDFIGSGRLVNLQWIVNESGYSYLQAFYRYHQRKGSDVFEIDLVIDESTATTYQANFVPDTFQLVSHEGLRYVVTATIKTKFVEYDAEDDLAAITPEGTLRLDPEVISYTAHQTDDFLDTGLNAAIDNFASNILGTCISATLLFILDADEFDYLQAFHRHYTRNPTTPFQLELIVGEKALTTHLCVFVPGTYSITGLNDESYTITCEVEAKPKSYNPTTDESLIDAFTI